MPGKPTKAATKAASRTRTAKSAAAKKSKAAAKPRAAAARSKAATAPDAQVGGWTAAAEPAPAPAAAPPPVQVVSWGIPPPAGWPSTPQPRLVMRPTRGLSGALVVLLAVSVGVSALTLVAMALVEDWGQPGSPGSGAGVMVLQSLTSMVGGAASIALVVVFCIWLHRTLANAKASHPAAGINPGWAVGSFFIPFVQLVIPYFEVARAWRADVSQDARPVAWWFVPWAIYVLSAYAIGVLSVGVAFRTAMATFDTADADTSAIYEEMRPLQLAAAAVSLPLQAIAAYFLARLARQWTDHQEGPPVS